MGSAIRKMIKNYFDETLELNVQAFNLLGFAGTAAGIVVAIISLAQNAGAFMVILNLLASALAITLLCVTGKKLSYRASSWIVVIAVFMLTFPVMFFTAGGYRSGMPCFFIFAILFTAILLEKRARTAAVIIEFSLYLGCCVTAYLYPGMIAHFELEIFYVSDVITGLLVSGILLLLVVSLYIRMHRLHLAQIKELNRELKARNDQLTSFDKMKSKFLAVVAHEINAPLTSIAASGADTKELLKDSPIDMDEIMKNQERIENKAMRIAHIVNDLMDTVAIETGRLPLSRQPVMLSELLKNTCEQEFKQHDKNGNIITFDFQAGLPKVWADVGRIEQVLANLIGNSVWYTKGGEITVKLTREGCRQTVCVTDNGEGMEPELAAEVLKEYQTSGRDKENWRHGYGLYICRQIILSHGGEIWVDSEKGRGTSVSFTLLEGQDE